MDLVKRFILEEDGMGTVELVLIVAALVSIAILFKKQITTFVNDSLGSIFSDGVKQETNPLPAEG